MLAIGGAGWALWYVLACWIFPFASCRNCGGDGKWRSPSGRTWRRCRRCKGTGRRLRVGRKLLNAWSETAAKGTK